MASLRVRIESLQRDMAVSKAIQAKVTLPDMSLAALCARLRSLLETRPDADNQGSATVRSAVVIAELAMRLLRVCDFEERVQALEAVGANLAPQALLSIMGRLETLAGLGRQSGLAVSQLDMFKSLVRSELAEF
jgi:hypothetical protein